MGAINPFRKDVVSTNGAESVPKGAQETDETAKKVANLKLPKAQNIGLRSRQITPLKEAKALAKEIHKVWDSLELDKLAAKIVRLEDIVATLDETSAEAQKVKRVAQHYHFCFVHPGAKEVEEERDGKTMPFSFVQSVREIADRMLQTNSIAPFEELNSMQRHEVMRYAAVGG